MHLSLERRAQVPDGAGNGMKYSRYLQLEKYIAASDTGGIIDRWRYGRRLIEDGDATTPAGNLKHGVLDKLIAQASARGIRISRSEINYRMQCGRAYVTEAEISTACGDFKTWSDLRAAGFPPVQVPLGAETDPFDPRGADEKRRDAAREMVRIAEEAGGQLALFDHFPADRFDKLVTLSELTKWASEMADWTERQADADRRRLAYLKDLTDAVHGDLGKTWEEAQAALDAQAP